MQIRKAIRPTLLAVTVTKAQFANQYLHASCRDNANLYIKNTGNS